MDGNIDGLLSWADSTLSGKTKRQPAENPQAKAKIYEAAKKAKQFGYDIPDDVAEDFYHLTSLESGRNHYLPDGRTVKTGVKTPNGDFAIGFSQVMGETAKPYKSKGLDPYNEVDNIAIGLNEFLKGDAADPVARRLAYVGGAGDGNKALQQYRKTGVIPESKLYSYLPKNKETFFSYVNHSGGFKGLNNWADNQLNGNAQKNDENSLKDWADRELQASGSEQAEIPPTPEQIAAAQNFNALDSPPKTTTQVIPDPSTTFPANQPAQTPVLQQAAETVQTPRAPLLLDDGKGAKFIEAGSRDGLKENEFRVRNLATDKGSLYIATKTAEGYAIRPENEPATALPTQKGHHTNKFSAVKNPTETTVSNDSFTSADPTPEQLAEGSALADKANPTAESYNQELANYNERISQPVEAKTDTDILDKGSAGSLEVDLSEKPKGENAGRWLLKQALRQVSAKYDFSDAEIENAVGSAAAGNTFYDRLAEEDLPNVLESLKATGGSTRVRVDLTNRNINDILQKRSGGELRQIHPELRNQILMDETLSGAGLEKSQHNSGIAFKEAESENALRRRAGETDYAASQTAAEYLGTGEMFKDMASFGALGSLLGVETSDKGKRLLTSLGSDVPPPSQEWVDGEMNRLKAQHGDFTKAWKAEQYYQNADALEKAIRTANQVGRSFVKNLVSGSAKGVLFVGDLFEKNSPVNKILPDKMQIGFRNVGNALDFSLRLLTGPSSKDAVDFFNNKWVKGDAPLDEQQLFKATKQFDEAIGDDPVLKGRILGSLADAGGSALAFVAIGALTPQLSLATRFGEFGGGSAIAGALQSAGGGYEEGRSAGLSEEKARAFGVVQGILGATEGFGIGGEIGELIKNPSIRRNLAEGLLHVAKNGIYKGGKEEFFQELIQTTGGKIALEALKDQDPTAYGKIKNILNRLPKQLAETTTNEALIAFATGGALGGATHGIQAANNLRSDEKGISVEDAADAKAENPVAEAEQEARTVAAAEEAKRAEAAEVPESDAKVNLKTDKETSMPETVSFPDAPKTAQKTDLRGRVKQNANLFFGKPVSTENETKIQSAKPVENTDLVKNEIKTKPPREFSTTQVDFPEAEAREVQALGKKLIDESDVVEREDKTHATVNFGLHTDKADDVRSFLEKEKPFEVTLGKTSIFPAKEGQDFDVVKVDVVSPEIHRLNKLIGNNTKVTKTQPEFVPHVTLGKVKAGTGEKYIGDASLEGRKITFDAITFSDKNRRKFSIKLEGAESAASGEVLTPAEAFAKSIDTIFARSQENGKQAYQKERQTKFKQTIAGIETNAREVSENELDDALQTALDNKLLPDFVSHLKTKDLSVTQKDQINTWIEDENLGVEKFPTGKDGRAIAGFGVGDKVEHVSGTRTGEIVDSPQGLAVKYKAKGNNQQVILTENNWRKIGVSKGTENLPEQRRQEVLPQKPIAQVVTAERPKSAKTLNVFTERGTKASIEPKVVDSSDLLTSLDEGYPQELQPRDRSRAASKAQISEIANKLNPEFLGDSLKASDGRPLVVSVEIDGKTKYAVISGNGRTAAIKQAYNSDGDGATKYFNFAKEKDSSSVHEQPVYVGVLDANEIKNLPEFAKEANESATAQMSATEQARADSERLDSGLMKQFVPSDDGSVHTAANRDFVRGFVENVSSVAERGKLQMPDGTLSQEGAARIRNAVFAKAFGTSEAGMSAITRMAESTDNNVRNITNGLLAKAGELAELKVSIKEGTRFAELDITDDLAKAMEKYSFLRDAGSNVAEYLQQQNLFGDDLSPFQKRVLQVFDNHKRSAKAVRSILDNFLSAANAAGNPHQENLFGATVAPNVESFFKAAVETYENTITGKQTGQTGLFDTDQRRENRPASGEFSETSDSGKSEEERKTKSRPESRIARLETASEKGESKNLKKTVIDPNSDEAKYQQELAKTVSKSELLPKVSSKAAGDEVSISPEAGEIIRFVNAIVDDEDIETAPAIAGLFLDENAVASYAEVLDELAAQAEENGQERSTLDKLKNDILAASKENGTVLIAAFPEARNHERIHQLGYVHALDKSLENRHAHFDKLVNLKSDDESRSILEKAHGNFFADNGYSIEDKGVLVEEIGTYIATDNYDILGLSDEEAARFLENWLDSYAAKNGVEILEKIGEFIDEKSGTAGLIKRIHQRRVDASSSRVEAAEKRGESDSNSGLAKTAPSSKGSAKLTEPTDRKPEIKERKTVVSAEKAEVVEKNSITMDARYYQVKSRNSNIRRAQERIEEIGLAQAAHEAVNSIPKETELAEHKALQMETVNLLNAQAIEAGEQNNPVFARAKLQSAQQIVSKIAEQGTDYGQAISQLAAWQKTDPEAVTGYVQKRRAQKGYDEALTPEQSRAVKESAEALGEANRKLDALQDKIIDLEKQLDESKTSEKKSVNTKNGKTKPLNSVEKSIVQDLQNKSEETAKRLKEKFDSARKTGNSVLKMATPIKSGIIGGSAEKLDAETLKDLSVIGAERLLVGLKGEPLSVEVFKKSFLNTFGDGVRPYLSEIHALSVKELQRVKSEAYRARAVETLKNIKGNEDLTLEDLSEIVENQIKEQKDKAKIRAEHKNEADKFFNAGKVEQKEKQREAKEQEKADLPSFAKSLFKVAATENKEVHLGAFYLETGQVKTADELARRLRESFPNLSSREALNASSLAARSRNLAHRDLQAEREQLKSRKDNAQTEAEKFRKERNAAQRQLLNRIKFLENPPIGYFERIGRTQKAFIVSAVQTVSNNFLTAQGSRKIVAATDLVEVLFNKGLAKAGKEFDYENNLSSQTRIQDVLGFPDSDNYGVADVVKHYFTDAIFARGIANSVLDEYPSLFEATFGSYASDVEVARERKGADGAADWAMQKVEKTAERVNILNYLQEFLVRSQEFNYALQLRLGQRNLNLPDVIKNNQIIEKVTEEDLKYAVHRALQVTFALKPDKVTGFGKLASLYQETVPSILQPYLVTFPNYLYNATKFVTDYAPLVGYAKAGIKIARSDDSFLKSLTENANPRVAAQQLVGTALFLVALQLVRAAGDDDKWYYLKTPFTDSEGKNYYIDVRGYQPFASMIFMANKFNRFSNDKPMFSDRETAVMETLEAMTGFSSRNIEEGKLAQAIYYKVFGSKSNDGKDNERVWYLLQQEFGDRLGGWIRPLKTIKDVVAQFDKFEAKIPDTVARPIAQGIARSLPFANRLLKLEPRKDFATGNESSQVAPALKVFGVSLINPDFHKEIPSRALVMMRDIGDFRPFERDPLPESQRKSAAISSLYRLMARAGDDKAKQKAVTNAIKRAEEQGILEAGQLEFMTRKKGLTELESLAKTAKLEEIERIYKVATDSEKILLDPIVETKKENKLKEAERLEDEKYKNRVRSGEVSFDDADKALAAKLEAGTITEKQYIEKLEAMSISESEEEAKNLNASSSADFMKIEKFVKNLAPENRESVYNVLLEKTEKKLKAKDVKSAREAERLMQIIETNFADFEK